MNPRQLLVVFTPSGRRARFEPGTTVLDAARRLGVDLDSVCGGRGICGRCQVAVSEGEHAKHGISCTAAALGPLSGVEQAYAETHELAPTRRLGCTARIDADVVIDVPPESQVYRQVVRKEADARAIAVDPVVRLHYVEVEEPELASPTSDSGRLLLALEREWGLTGLTVDVHVLQHLQHALRKGDPWRVTVAVHDGTAVTAIWPEFHDTAYGIAFDVGSTTVAGHLCDLHTGNVLASAGEMNPQIRFGEDLMSRVSYVMLNAGAEKELTRAVRGCLAKLTAELATAAAGRAHGHPRGHVRGEPRDASPPARDRPQGAWRRSVRARRRHQPAAAGGRARSPGQPGSAGIRPPLHRGARRCRYRGGDPVGGSVRGRRGHPDRRRRHECRDRAREPRAAVGGVEPDGAGLRGRADLGGPARRAGRDRAGADRSRDAGAARARDRLRGLVGRAGFRRGPGHGHLRLGDRRGDRRAPSRRGDRDGRHDRRSSRVPVAPASCRTAGRTRTSSTTASPSFE